MPFSTGYFKSQTIDYIEKNFDKTIRILDIGAGCGTYSDLLTPKGYENIDCIEVFEDYIHKYNLRKKYKNVFICDATKCDVNFTNYDLIILGDVLEHIDLEDSKSLISKMKFSDLIIAVPFESPQGESFGNTHEIHLQEDLNFINFFERFPRLKPFCLRFDYGVFLTKTDNLINVEHNEKPIPHHYLEYIDNNFKDMEIKNINEETILTKVNIDEKIKPTTNTTIVTGLWDMGRGKINESFKRTYDDYLKKFEELLKTDIPMYIFADKSDEEFIWSIRDKKNTVINFMSKEELNSWFEFTDITNRIRQDESWLSQTSWLRESPQATLDSYNPMVMSKMFMLNNVTIWNPFESDYFFWIDAGITNTVHYGYFTHDKVFDKLPDFIEKNEDFLFISYPYIGGEEIHGFDRKKIADICNVDYVKYVCRGGFFGGKKQRINDINGLYYGYLNSTLSQGFMGTEESIFTIIMHNHSDIIAQYSIEDNGLIWPFFEDLKNDTWSNNILKKNKIFVDISKTSLYVIGFNSPNQLKTLIRSMIEYDENFIKKPKKYLLNNSTDRSTDEGYRELCDAYNFEIITTGENLGICGGRQYIAEHFDKSDEDLMFFFEDDMFFYPKKGEVCRNGFNRYVENLYDKTLEIIKNENFDFLKLNFTEFFGDNSVQWSWYNVPQQVREEFWPEKNRLPENGLDPNAPRTKYDSVKSFGGIPYTNGEIYYCNWPQVVSKEGNKKMFLETKWAHPYEQTWMSYMYQETKKGNIKGGLMLLTPTEHNRFEHYGRELRKES